MKVVEGTMSIEVVGKVLGLDRRKAIGTVGMEGRKDIE